MKFKSSIFAIMTVIPCVTLYVNDAKATNCSAGDYQWALACHKCSKGCYCEGHGDNQSWGALTCYPESGSYKLGAKSFGSAYAPHKIGVCPKEFPESDAGTNSERNCYKEYNGKRLYNRSETCKAGWYFPKNSNGCEPCPKGEKDYCPGGTFKPKTIDDQGLSQCSSSQKANSNHSGCENKAINVTCKAGQYLQAGMTYCTPCRDRYYCLGGSFTTASIDQGLKSCTNNSKPNAAKTACVITCKAGQYLPGKAASCRSCKDRYYCPGGTYFASPNVLAYNRDQGLLSCPSNKVPNKDKTACEFQKNVHDAKPVDSQPVENGPETFNCSVGQYLPAKAKNCQQCKSGYYCAGGDYAYADIDQGAAQCPAGFHPNEAQTECEKDLPNEVTCTAGFYLPSKTMECKKCTNSKRYCPGGKTFKKADFDQGIYNCPTTSVANDDKSACVLKLSKSFLQYGSNEKASLSEQCWANTDSAKYKICLFGNQVVLPEVVIDTDAE